jgi:hypothetical protein
MDAETSTARFETLPEPVDPDTMIESKESSPVPDPLAGRDEWRDYILPRVAG